MIAKKLRQILRVRFSLKTLLVLMTLACAVFAWLGFRFKESREQRGQMQLLHQYGGWVAPIRSRASTIDRWLGPSFTIYSLRVATAQAHSVQEYLIEENLDKQFEIIAEMNGVYSLLIPCGRGYECKHAGYLRKMTTAHILELENANQEQLNSILKILPEMDQLRIFGIYRNGINAAHPTFDRAMVKVFADCHRLEVIDLEWIKVISDEALEEIGTNPLLQEKEFYISPHHLTEEQLARAKSFPNIKLE